jgi:hypothetical protein
MLSLHDERWQSLAGGYRQVFDPRPMLLKLEADTDTKSAWNELWEGLHHQGDVGTASYAAVPQLVRIYRTKENIDWNTYAMVATIELAREDSNNPVMPKWLENDYFRAIHELAEFGAGQVLSSRNQEEIRGILSIIALSADARTHARFLLDYSAE